MRKLSWKVCLERNCNGTLSSTTEVKYKKASYTIKVPDIDAIEDGDDLYKRWEKGIITTFGKKKGKKIFNQVLDELSEL